MSETFNRRLGRPADDGLFIISLSFSEFLCGAGDRDLDLVRLTRPRVGVSEITVFLFSSACSSSRCSREGVRARSLRKRLKGEKDLSLSLIVSSSGDSENVFRSRGGVLSAATTLSAAAPRIRRTRVGVEVRPALSFV